MMNDKTVQSLKDCIYYLKVAELQTICAEYGYNKKVKKQDYINFVLERVQPESTNLETASSSKNRAKKEGSTKTLEADRRDPKQYLIPGIYKNNRNYRQLFTTLIGSHFRFTTYGMQWIKEQWQKGHIPSIGEFASYWESEYQRRKQTNDFESPQTLQRVNFFRAMKSKQLSKAELESAWQQERLSRAKQALSLLKQLQQD